MSNQLTSRSTTRSNPQPTNERIDSYVVRQLKRTTQQVRFSDLATGLLAMVAFALAFLFLAAIVDAWIWPLTTFARWSALVLLVGGLAAIAWFLLLPLLILKINPQYAAKMIEDAKPGFKNSLLNYLELKRDKRPVQRAILNEVSKRAATDLSTVTIESAVDKSNLIRVGFALVGLVAISIAYVVFSPKSPLPTLKRVLAPGAKIAQPAAVTIFGVTPGDTSVFFGDRQEIAAQISGTHDVDDVRLIYSSLDGQVVDSVLPMSFTGAPGIYSAILETGPSGIQQPLTYRVAARDGASPDYSIDVRPNPSISINSITITPPGYTKLPVRTLKGYGEIQAVEGSRVEIAVAANLPIEVAYIVPLLAKDDSPENDEFRELRSITMKSSGNEATGNFVAALNANRDRPLFTHYKIMFRSPDDNQNERANIFPVGVIADLAPEVEITEPRQRELLVPVNQPFPVEIRAADLDYEISAVTLNIDHQGTKILDRGLHGKVNEQDASGPVSVRLQLRPSDLSLEPGDKAIMFATAADNRISPSSGLPDPNISRTENYTLIITDPIANPKQPSQPPQKQPQTGDDQSDQQPQGNSNPQSGTGSDEQPSDPKDGSPNDGDSDSKTESDQTIEDGSDSDSDSAPGGDEQKSDAPSDAQGSSEPAGSDSQSDSQSQSEPESDPSDSQSGSANGSASDSPDEPSDNQQNASDGSQSDQPNEQNQQTQGGTGGQQRDGDANQESDGTTDDSAGGVQREPTDERGNSTGQDGENNGGQSAGQEFRDRQLDNGENGDTQPLAENAPEGDQFERLKEYVEQKQKQPQENSGHRATNNVDDENTPELDANRQPTEPKEQSDNDGPRDDPSQKSDAPSSSQPADQRTKNPEPQPVSPNSEGENSDRARDGQPDQDVPNGSESENGKPDESETGSGSRSASTSDENRPAESSGNPDSKEQGQPQQGNSDSRKADPDQPPENDAPTPSTGDSREEEQKQPQDSQQSPASEQQEPAADGAGGGSSSTEPASEEPSSSESSSGEPSSSASSSKEPSASASKSASDGNESSSEPAAGQDPPPSMGNNQTADPQKFATATDSKPPASDGQPSQPQTGGNASSNSSSASASDSNPDKANLDYARQVTDLILDELDDQQFNPDQELLDQMNWTQQDLAKFLSNWQKMKDNAKSGDVKAKLKYEDALRSLALERDPKGRTVKIKKDDPLQLNEDGAVDQIPAEYVDRFNSFLKRRNRSKRTP